MTDKCILAIDLGTSGPKVALVSTTGEVLGSEFEPNEVLLLPGGGAEQRPDDWWDTITTASRRLLSRGLAPLDDVAAVVCTSQWSGTVAVDRDGRPLMNAIIWMDSRGAQHVRKLTSGLINVAGYSPRALMTWLRRTGGIPSHSGKDPIAHILYIREAHPEIYDATYKFLEVKDYLNAKLTGRFAASFDSIALHWLTDNRDIDKVRYDDKLLAWAKIPREKLPDLRRAVDVLGPLLPESAEQLGLSAGLPVVMGTPDMHSAAVGSGAVEDFRGHLYVGTSSWLLCHVPYLKTDILHNMASLPSAIPDRYLLSNEQESAGNCLTFLKNNVLFADDELAAGPAPEDIYERMDRVAAEAPAGSGKLIFTPWLYGERTPIDDHTVRGGFANLSLTTKRSDIVRSVLEGVAYNARWLLQSVERFMRHRMDTVNFIGGGARSALWCQIMADVFDRDIAQVHDSINANLRGVAFVAAIGLGLMSFEDVPERVEIAKVYQPNPAHRAIYDELFTEFKNLYRRNKSIYARLNR